MSTRQANTDRYGRVNCILVSTCAARTGWRCGAGECHRVVKGRAGRAGRVGKEPRGTAAFIQAGYTLFDNARDVAALADFGYDADKIAAERAKIEAYDQANQAQEMAKGSAQQATQDQDAALAAMSDWVAQYLKIAKVALRGKKQ